MGFKTRYSDLSLHTVSEVEYGGRWHAYDNSLSTLYTLCDGKTIAALLVEQVTSLVRWRESVMFMKAHGVEMLIELGAGKVLSTLAPRIDKDLSAQSVATPADIDRVLKLL